MFIDTTLTFSDLSSWCASGKCYWNVTPSWEWEQIHHVPVSHQSSESWMFIIECSLFLFHCLTVFVFFLPTLNCTGQDILFWNGKTRSALITRLCYFYSINRILSLYWNIVRACILCAMKKNRPKLDHNIIYSWKTFFLKWSNILRDLNLCMNWACGLCDRPFFAISLYFTYLRDTGWLVTENIVWPLRVLHIDYAFYVFDY